MYFRIDSLIINIACCREQGVDMSMKNNKTNTRRFSTFFCQRYISYSKNKPALNLDNAPYCARKIVLMLFG